MAPLRTRLHPSWKSTVGFTSDTSVLGATVPLSTLCLQSQAQDRPLSSQVLLSWLHSGLVFTQSSRKPDHWERIYHLTDIIILSLYPFSLSLKLPLLCVPNFVQVSFSCYPWKLNRDLLLALTRFVFYHMYYHVGFEWGFFMEIQVKEVPVT